MKGFWTVAVLGSVAAAMLAATAGGAARTASGDKCTALGSGTSYSVTVTVPSRAPQQAAFAFGAPSANITNIAMSGTEGNLSTSNLPANTSGEWQLSNAISAGSYVATIQTSNQVSGSFTLVPVMTSGLLDPVTCQLGKTSTPAKVVSNIFVPASGAVYNSKAGFWSLRVNVANPGVVVLRHDGKTFVKNERIATKHKGKVAVILHPNAAAKTLLRAKGVVKLKLKLIYTPTGGTARVRVVALNLRR